jgi:hypothetical protein
MSNYGGVQWMCHPKLVFDQISSYSETSFTNAANNAINDDCISTYISLDNTINPDMAQIFNNELILTVDQPEKVSIRLVSLNGQIIYSSEKNLAAGLNRVIIDNSSIVKGMYILEIKGNSGVHYRNKVTLK